LFGDVPFLTNSISPKDLNAIINGDGSYTPADKGKRIDKNEILNSLVIDLDAAADALPVSYNRDNRGRVTKGAALTLKARILLMQKKWAEAAIAAKEVMDLNTYSLFAEYGKLFDYAGVDCAEVIFDIQVVQKKSKGEFWLPNYGPNSVGGWSCLCPLQSLVDTYECTDGTTINDPASIYDPAQPYANRDPRLYHSILYPGRPWQWGVYNTIPGASYPGKTIVPGDNLNDGTGGQWNKSATGYNILKYISQQDIETSNFWDSSIHYILMRYAEVLLMYAEAKIEDNSIDQSVYDAINKVRRDRDDVKMPEITSGKSQAELREIVRRERRVEFAFEGMRLFDIRRWEIAHEVMPGEAKGLTYTDPQTGNPVTLSGGTRVFDQSKHYLWPIPQAEIDITHIVQNNGW
jgi:hypothetical protein